MDTMLHVKTRFPYYHPIMCSFQVWLLAFLAPKTCWNTQRAACTCQHIAATGKFISIFGKGTDAGFDSKFSHNNTEVQLLNLSAELAAIVQLIQKVFSFLAVKCFVSPL